VALSACGECRVDGSSNANLMDSLDEMSRSLDPVELSRFEDAILAITEFELARSSSSGDHHRGLAHYLNGLTYEEIVACPETLGRNTGRETVPRR